MAQPSPSPAAGWPATAPEQPPAPQPDAPLHLRRHRRTIRRVVLASALLIGGVLLLTAVDAARVAVHLDGGRDRLADLADADDVGAEARRASRDLQDAERIVDDGIGLSILRSVPVLGPQLREVTRIVHEVADIGIAAGDAVAELDEAAEHASDGAARVALLARAGDRLAAVRALVEDARGRDRELAWPLQGIDAAVGDELDDRADELATAAERLDAIHALLEGPTTYLVLGANNAEMSGSVGMPLTAGVLRIEGGELDLSDFTQSAELLAPGGDPLPQNLYDLYANQGIGYDIRGTTASPNFPLVAPIIADMSARVATGPVDGVFLLDTIAVGHLVDLAGPVTVDGEVYDGAATVHQLLVGNYAEFGAARDDRVQAQGAFAEAVFDRVTAGDVDVLSLARELADLAPMRHVLAWSRDPTLQSLWSDLDADGAVGPRSIAVSLENMDGNKLDPYFQPRVRITTVELPDGSRQADISVELENVVPLDTTSPYILGPGPEIHFTQLVLHLPEGSRILGVLEAPPRLLEVQGTDTHSVVQTALYGAPAGRTTTYAVRARLPASLDELEIVPSARYRSTLYDVDGRQFVDVLPVTVPLDGADGARRPSMLLVAVALSSLLLAGVPTVAQLRRRRRSATAVPGPPATT